MPRLLERFIASALLLGGDCAHGVHTAAPRHSHDQSAAISADGSVMVNRREEERQNFWWSPSTPAPGPRPNSKSSAATTPKPTLAKMPAMSNGQAPAKKKPWLKPGASSKTNQSHTMSSKPTNEQLSNMKSLPDIFFLISNGTCTDHGYFFVKEHNECNVAADILNLNDQLATDADESTHTPQGCYFMPKQQRNRLWFNTNPANAGNGAMPGRSQICRKEEKPTTLPPADLRGPSAPPTTTTAVLNSRSAKEEKNAAKSIMPRHLSFAWIGATIIVSVPSTLV